MLNSVDKNISGLMPFLPLVPLIYQVRSFLLIPSLFLSCSSLIGFYLQVPSLQLLQFSHLLVKSWKSAQTSSAMQMYNTPSFFSTSLKLAPPPSPVLIKNPADSNQAVHLLVQMARLFSLIRHSMTSFSFAKALVNS